MEEKTLQELLSEAWGSVKFDERQVLSRPPRKHPNERDLLGYTSVRTNVMGTVDNSLLKAISAVSR